MRIATLRCIVGISFILFGNVGLVQAKSWREYLHVDQIERSIKQAFNTILASMTQKKSMVSAGVAQDQGVSAFDEMVKRSEALLVKLPTKHNRISEIAGDDVVRKRRIVDQARHVKIVYHEKVLQLLQSFLRYKQMYGTDIEKNYYATMSAQGMIRRLIEKRPLMFMNTTDMFVLRNGVSGSGGFEAIGTSEQKLPLVLADYLSYDEMQIAALLELFVPTYFINNGDRYNSAQPGVRGSFQEEGMYVGIVGARFEKPEYMEWQHIVVTPVRDVWLKNHAKYVSIWEQFYDQKFVTYNDARLDTTGRFIALEIHGKTAFFDTLMYKKRMKLVIEPFLKEAAISGKSTKKLVYIHAVGLGLGVWQILPQQAQLLLDVYQDVLNTMSSDEVQWISDIDFSWFPQGLNFSKVRGSTMFKAKSGHVIAIKFSKRNPADRLIGPDQEKLLVAQYAWDGNAYPGNEYWAKQLTASGDPAAACCSTIAELQNPAVNLYMFAS